MTDTASLDQASQPLQLRNFYLARQPLLDRNQALFGYELLFRSSGVDRAAVADGSIDTVLVDGEVLVKGGKLTKADEGEVYARADAAIAHERPRHALGDHGHRDLLAHEFPRRQARPLQKRSGLVSNHADTFTRCHC